MRRVFFSFLVALAALIAVTAAFGQGGSDSIRVSAGKHPVDAGVGGGVVITAPTITQLPASSFSADYQISDVSGRGIISYQMDLQYDPAVVQYNSCSTVGTISSVGTILCNNSSPGLIELVWTSVNVLNNDGDGPPSILFKVNFTAIGSAGSVSLLTFTDVQVMEFAVPAVAVPGAITLGIPTAAEVSVIGRVLDASGRAIPKARVTMLGSGGAKYAVTNAFGYYRFAEVQANQAYVLSVQSKRYTFTPKTVTPSDNIFDLDFVAEP
jgi:hypothetical protein